jgi:hypothetical protein
MTEDPETTLSWQEREIIGALRRLANARSNVLGLEAQAGGPPLDAQDVARAEALAGERAELRPKADSRFGGSGARERIAAIEGELRLVLDRLGVGDLDELRERVARQGSDAVDPQVLDFARRELDGALQAWREIRDLELPPSEPASVDASDDADEADDEGAQVVPFDRRSAS